MEDMKTDFFFLKGKQINGFLLVLEIQCETSKMGRVASVKCSSV